MGDYSNSSYSAPFSDAHHEPEHPTEKCSVCDEQTSHGADVDRNDGRGFVRYPVCDTGCLQELMEQLGGGAGSQLRARYPSAEDPA